ncbi:peptidase T [Solitalea lacus]|uniref:peptidase T n=1 Tax=Solitalea lacus TaxID=2911172 RepID=UPI001EDB5763|nr:peptidase T [Solitalea lacus]UKJ08366.1 peptidase T [Solitalea lacus]
MNNYKFTVTERFMRYVQVDTQSDPHSTAAPTTQKQKNLSRILVEELKAMGIDDAHLDDFGYVYATIPATSEKNVPVLCFCSHVDTSPDCSGAGVKPIIHKNYQGQDLVLPDDPSQVIKKADHQDLAEQIGNDIITASGTTLLGADNKAGVAEIMDAANYFMQHPEVKHGKIRILFTPDEEVGRGVNNVDMKKLGADFGYTMDGETLGSLENETFSANGLTLLIHGVSSHPGFAKGKMESAIKIASEIVAALPKGHLSPETTEGKEGFVHPVEIGGTVEESKVSFIIRDHVTANLAKHEGVIKQIADQVIANYPFSKYEIKVTEQYRNFKEVLDQYPQVIENALEGIRRSGMEPKLQSIRGGTDGSRLSFMGLPCPNVFAGEHAFHSKHEWASVQDMQKAVETIVNIASVWEEKA